MSAEPPKDTTKLSAASAGIRNRSPSYSRSQTRPRHSRSSSFMPENPEALVSIDGTVGEETVELLREFVHPHHHRDVEETLIEEGEGLSDSRDIEDGPPGAGGDDSDKLEDDEWEGKPWYRRPSPWWLICMMPFSAIAMTATIVPRIEIYTYLACKEHKPEYTVGKSSTSLSLGLSSPAAANTLPYNSGSLTGDDFMSTLPFLYTPSSTNGLLNNYVTPFYADYPLIPFESWNATDKDSYDEKPQEDGDKEDEDIDPNLCASDPEVQAAVAQFMFIMSLTMGVLSCLTTGWWGSFSDRHGRLTIMGISVVGLLLTDYNFIFVSFFYERLPGNYYFLLLGPLVEGALGGMTSAVAANHAYIADCTAPHSRSRIFSLSIGLLFVGMAIGPTVGGLLIKVTGSILSVFWLTAVIHTIYAFLVWFVIPESLGKKRMEKAKRDRAMAIRDGNPNENIVLGDLETNTEMTGSTGIKISRSTRMTRSLKKILSKMFGFLSPLAALAPRDIEGDEVSEGGKIAKGLFRKRDWNMTLIGLGHGSASMVFASYQYKFQFLEAQFHWTSEELGYLVSLAGATRAAYLTLILPIAIKYLKSKKPPIQLPTEELEPLHPDRPSPITALEIPESSAIPTKSSSTPATSSSSKKSTAAATHDPSFDLSLAKFSLAVDFMAFIIMPFALHPAPFVVLTAAVSLGAGFGPALQSLALELFSRHNANETGKLFGALSVISSISSQVIGPAVFGLTYMKTVGTYPRTIFFVSAAVVGIALLLMSFVQLPKEDHSVNRNVAASSRPGIDRERTLVDTPGLERGRKSTRSLSAELAV